LIVPASSIIVSFVDFLISGMIMLALMAVVQLCTFLAHPDATRIYRIAFAASMGVGLWFAALNVRYRDFRYIVPFIVQIGLYISPVGFSTSIVPKSGV
jgi:lipopolysaccharide transport system permease protein